MAQAIPWIIMAVSTYATVRAGQAQSATAKYAAQVSQQNSAAMQQQGAAAAAAQRRDAMRKLGLLAANYGASGVDPSTGSPLDVLSDSVGQATLDNLNVRYNYQLRALGYQNSSTLDSAQASDATTSSYLSAAGSLLGGAGKAYSQQYGSGTGIPVTPDGYYSRPPSGSY